MALDVRELDLFYESPMGQVARRLVLQRLRAAWPDLAGQRLLGFGFATPYLKAFTGEAERTLAAMPAQRASPPGGRHCSQPRWSKNILCRFQILPSTAFFSCMGLR